MPSDFNQVFVRYSADSDFVCENEYSRTFNELPAFKQWYSVYQHDHVKLLESFTNKIDNFVKKNRLTVEEKLSKVDDITAKTNVNTPQPSNDVCESDYSSSDDYDRTSESSFEHIYLLTSPLGDHALFSYLKDYEGNVRIILQTTKQGNVFHEFLKNFVDSISAFKKKRKVIPQIKIIASGADGLKTLSFDIKKFPEMDKMLDTHYNDDFKPFANYLVDRLMNTSHGIALLHGVPGTGKTNFIRWLANKVGNDKSIIYIPPDLVSVLTSPNFVEFVMDNKNSIFIVEDAENVIENRAQLRSSAVNNILNLCDGIIGEAVKCQFVCTFNCEFNKIDKALKRPGRLIGEWEFKPLTKDKSEKLAKLIHGKKVKFTKPMTLAEIYNMNDPSFVVEDVKKPHKTLGFNAS